MTKKILFVCLGNICRSPLAEGIMLHLAKEKKLDVLIDSAGTANYHVGEAPDKRTIDSAQKQGIGLHDLRARQFSINDFETFDFIFAMDKQNLKVILTSTHQAHYKNKVHLFLNYVYPNSLKEVPDPYYGSEKDFDAVFKLVYEACEQLCVQL